MALVHWNAAEATERAAKLEAAGYDVTNDITQWPAFLERLRSDPPDAAVIDLSRMPSQGRDLGVFLRKRKATRAIPLVFVGGAPEKVARTKRLLPDAEFTTWSRIRSSLKRAIANPPETVVVPNSAMAAYAGTPLVKKLGINADSTVNLIGAPKDFEETLGRLPRGVQFKRRAGARGDLTLWFVTKRSDLEGRVERIGASLGDGGLWIIWPKKNSGIASDLTQAAVRKVGMASGLVDYKVCKVDERWTGLRFARRVKEDRQG